MNGYAYSSDLVEPGHRLTAFAVIALALTAAAAAAASKPYGLMSILSVYTCLLVGTLELLPFGDFKEPLTDFNRIHEWVGAPDTWLAALALMALMGVALFSEPFESRNRTGLAHHALPGVPYALYGTTAWLLGLLLMRDFGPLDEVVALAVAAVVAGLLVLFLRPLALACVSIALLLWAQALWLPVIIPSEAAFSWWEWSAWLAILLPLAFDRYFDRLKPRIPGTVFSWILVLSAWFVSIDYVLDRVAPPWRPCAIGVAAFAYLAYGLAFRSRPGAVAALFSGVLASGSAMARALDDGPSPGRAALLWDFATPTAFWIACDRLMKVAGERLRVTATALPVVAIAAADVLVLAYLHERIPADWFAFAAGLNAFAFLAYGLGLKSQPAAAAAVATSALISLLMLGRAYADEPALSPRPLLAAFAACAAFWILADRIYKYSAARLGFGLPKLPAVAIAAADVLVLTYLHESVPAHWFGAAVIASAYAFLAYGLGFRSTPATVAALLGAALASLLVVARTYGAASPLPTAPLVITYVACGAFWLLCERLFTFATVRLGVKLAFAKFSDVAIYTAAVLLVLMLARVPELRHYYLTVCWTALAFGFFALAVAFRTRPYRYSGLAIIALAFARAYVVDAFRLEGLYRAAAFAALSIVLLLIGYGYLKAVEYVRRISPRPDDANPPVA